MKKMMLAVLMLFPLSLFAQENYTLGSYWTVTSVETKPGHFDDYIEDLQKNWRRSLEMQKKEGHVLSYRMFSNVDRREGEPTLWLFVEHKSGADAYDRPFEYWEKHAEKLFGSMDKGDEAFIERGEIRTLKSNVLLRELSFK